MKIQSFLSPEEITALAKDRFTEERSIQQLTGWFRIKEIQKQCDIAFADSPACIRIAKTQLEVMKQIPLWISDYSVFAGTQDDAFARSYALINPAFTVESFTGYCDPVAVFGDIEPTEDITDQKIADLKEYNLHSAYSDKLMEAYDAAGDSTGEAIFFIEQVTGHLIPDVRPLLKYGVTALKEKLNQQKELSVSTDKKECFEAMIISLSALEILASRYAELAANKQIGQPQKIKERFALMEQTLRKVPSGGAENLYEAIQAFILIWQTMCMEQSPNPFAFSVGNADRIFEPYRAKENLDRATASALLKHLLVFYNVADRSWAISQNLMISGKSNDGEDLTNETSYALLDAYFDMNLPQPILSVKLHKNTPDELYKSMGRFFFTPGCLTPSFFNDDSIFPLLKNRSGVESCDLEDYSVAGCQEPLIMGKDNGNTTNSWLNLAKILELSINGGVSEITGKRLGKTDKENGFCNKTELLKNIREVFYNNLTEFTAKMVTAANKASEAVSLLQVPFLSAMMGGDESGIDLRDTKQQGTKYNGSGCLIHGLTIVADSFIAIDQFLKERPQDVDTLLLALQNDFNGYEEIRQYLLTCPKFGNNIAVVDDEAVEIANRVCEIVSTSKNNLQNAFRCDFATPSTHLLYGYWVGATPDGRKSREMLGYGVDPLFGDASAGMGFRVLSTMKLPFDKMNGGYASHFGIDPSYFKSETLEEKGMDFKKRVMQPLFFNENNTALAPFYLYLNVATPEMLRKVLENPKKYAPSGVYIVRIHGTFVNFLDLSPAIQNDIIKRLDLKSTCLA